MDREVGDQGDTKPAVESLMSVALVEDLVAPFQMFSNAAVPIVVSFATV